MNIRDNFYQEFKNWIFPIIVVVLYFYSRFVCLTLLPIFTDEAVYLHWAKMVQKDMADLWISVLIDNKKPLQVWLATINFSFFSDPLFAGRMVSGLAGALSLVGLVQIGKALQSYRLGWFLAFLYTISPYHLFFDRLAHESSLLNTCFIWTVWKSIKLFEIGRTPQLKDYVFLAFLAGVGFLTLATSLLFAFLPLVLKLIFFKSEWGPKWKHLFYCYAAALVWMATPYIIILLTHDNNPLQNIVIPNTHGQHKDGILSLFLSFPQKAFAHFPEITKYFTKYLTEPLFVLAAFYLVVRLKKVDRNDIIIMVFFSLPLLALAGTAGTGFSRYYLFCATPLIIWAGLGCVWIWNWFKERELKRHLILLLVCIQGMGFYPAVKFDYQMIFDPEVAPLANSDKMQFVHSLYSGYGVPEAVEFFKKQANEKKITLFTSSNWGTPANAMFVYLMDNPNIQLIQAFWIFERGILEPQIKTLQVHEFFTGKHLRRVDVSELGDLFLIKRTSSLFLNEPFIWANPNFEVVKAFPKPGMDYFVVIYKLKKVG